MDKYRTQGAFMQAEGALKKAAGNLTGDAKWKAEGKSEQVAGKLTNVMGGAKDAFHDRHN